MSEVSAPLIVAADVLRTYAEGLLAAGGFRAADARRAAELLLWANLRGVDSHGVLRIPRYVEMVGLGLINPKATPCIVRDTGAVALVDADLAPGATGMDLVTQTAIARARHLGAGICVGRNITHAGAIGFFANIVASQGFVGIAMTASKPLMAYPGARGDVVSTNPLAIAAPSSNPNEPIMLDMSTASVALGKIMAARDAKRAIPEGWGIDAEGRATTDPSQLKTLLPMGGAKGAGLSLMIEVLCSLLAGNPIIAPVLTGSNPVGFNGMIIALDPGAFGTAERFLADVQSLANAIHDLPPAPNVESILLPGERERHIQASRLAEGVPLERGTALKLADVAKKFGVPIPDALT